MAAVIPAPSARHLKRLEVIFFRLDSSLPPAIRSSPVERTFMPYRKNASPPNKVITENRSIVFSP